jgi:hypothetical protein
MYKREIILFPTSLTNNTSFTKQHIQQPTQQLNSNKHHHSSLNTTRKTCHLSLATQLE